MSAEKADAARSPFHPIKTNAELVKHLRERPVPRAEPHLTIGGSIEVSVKERLNRLRECRIRELHSGLRGAQERTESDFAFASLGGRARADFGRGR